MEPRRERGEGGGQGENTTKKGKEKEKHGRSDLPQGRWHPTHK